MYLWLLYAWHDEYFTCIFGYCTLGITSILHVSLVTVRLAWRVFYMYLWLLYAWLNGYFACIFGYSTLGLTSILYTSVSVSDISLVLFVLLLLLHIFCFVKIYRGWGREKTWNQTCSMQNSTSKLYAYNSINIT